MRGADGELRNDPSADVLDPSSSGGSSGIDSNVSGIGARPVKEGSRPASGSSMGGNEEVRDVDKAVGAVESADPVPATDRGRFGRVPGRDGTGAVTPGMMSKGRLSAGRPERVWQWGWKRDWSWRRRRIVVVVVVVAWRELAPLLEDPGPAASSAALGPGPPPGWREEQSRQSAGQYAPGHRHPRVPDHPPRQQILTHLDSSARRSSFAAFFSCR